MQGHAHQRRMAELLRAGFVGTAAIAAAPTVAWAEASWPPPSCQALQAKYPQFKGKTLVNAINPHTPGYEAFDPNDPSKYIDIDIDIDIDLGETIGACLGFGITYKPVAFASLMTTLASGQADIVISDIYATEERAKAGDFITYSKVFDGVLVAKGNPKKITGINDTMCGATAAENTGFVEVPLVQNLGPSCKAAGRPEPQPRFCGPLFRQQRRGLVGIPISGADRGTEAARGRDDLRDPRQ